MASIKERAAALNLAQKLCVRTPAQTSDPPPSARGSAAKPLHSSSSSSSSSSSLWSDLIFHLRSSVTVKRRWVHLKSHSDCFQGSEAADVLTQYIHHVRGFEGSAHVSRDRVASVCQALLDCGVMEAVGTRVFGKDKKLDAFQDSRGALYRFVSVNTPSIDELEEAMLANGIQKLFCRAPSDSPEESHVAVVTAVQSPPTSTNVDAPVTGSPSAEADPPSVSPGKLQVDSALPQSLVEEVWHQQTLLRLLNLVEVPLLEGVLQCSPALSPPAASHSLSHSNPDLIYSSNHLDRQILKAFRDTQEDEWLCAALDCLDFLPDQPVVELSRELPHCFPQEDQDSCDHGEGGSGGDRPRLSQSGLTQGQQLLYRTLVKHYSRTDGPPLMPPHMTDIYTAVTDLLVNAKLDKALEALQLCLKLLPPSGRDELRRLLTFMTLAADPQAIKLDKEVENRLAVKRSFSRAIFHGRALSKQNEDLLLVFMLSNIKEIFKIPGALHKGVSEKLARLVQETQPDVTGSTLSPHVPSKTFTDATRENTRQELTALLNSIHVNTKISAKEKKRLLGQFYQAHPNVFNQFFGDSAVSIL